MSTATDLDGRSAQNRASDRPGNGDPFAQTDHVDDGRWQVAQADRFAHHSPGRAMRWHQDKKRHADFRPVETLAMHEQSMFAQPLAMVGRDDDRV